MFATGDRASAALELAGLTALFDDVTVGTRTAPTLVTAIDALGTPPERTVAIAATATAVAAARDAQAGIAIAVARGYSSPEECDRPVRTPSSPICRSFCAPSPDGGAPAARQLKFATAAPMRSGTWRQGICRTRSLPKGISCSHLPAAPAGPRPHRPDSP